MHGALVLCSLQAHVWALRFDKYVMVCPNLLSDWRYVRKCATRYRGCEQVNRHFPRMLIIYSLITSPFLMQYIWSQMRWRDIVLSSVRMMVAPFFLRQKSKVSIRSRLTQSRLENGASRNRSCGFEIKTRAMRKSCCMAGEYWDTHRFIVGSKPTQLIAFTISLLLTLSLLAMRKLNCPEKLV